MATDGSQSTPTDPASLIQDYLKNISIEVLGKGGTIAVMITLLVLGAGLIGLAASQWTASETSTGRTSSVSRVVVVGPDGTTDTLGCDDSTSILTGDMPDSPAQVYLPAPCQSPPLIPQSGKGGPGTSSSGPSASSSGGSVGSHAGEGTSTTPAATTPPSAASVVPASSPLEGSPGTVSKRSSSFLLYLMLVGAGAVFLGGLLPRIHSLKLAGFEVVLGGGALPQKSILQLLKVIAGADKPPAKKKAAIDKLLALSQPVTSVRVIGKHPRPAATARGSSYTGRMLMRGPSEVDLESVSTGEELSDAEVQRLVEALLE